MITIIGNIKVDETNPVRVKYLLASIGSLAFLRSFGEFILCLQSASQELHLLAFKEMEDAGFEDFTVISDPIPLPYGQRYCELLEMAKYDFVLNFMEDQFCVMNDPLRLIALIKQMQEDHVDVLKTSFHEIELNSSRNLRRLASKYEFDPPGISFVHDAANFAQYQNHYGKRFYIGVNFLTTKSFAQKFWNRNLGNRPHEYEISTYSDQWLHTAMIPGPEFELQAPIDDDHGENGTCLLKRANPKFWRFYAGENVLAK